MSSCRKTNTKESFLDELVGELSQWLTGGVKQTSAFRIHNKQLDSLGDLSFPISLDYTAWREVKSHNAEETTKPCESIFDHASKLQNKCIDEYSIPKIAQEYGCKLRIAKCSLIKSNCHIFLDRQFVTNSVINEIVSNNTYGDYKIDYAVNLTAHCIDQDISNLRVKILHDILKNFVAIYERGGDDVTEILLTTKSSDTHANKILCGCILNETGLKEELLMGADLYSEYSSNMRMMFEHKYGVRNITVQPSWKAKIDKLGHAAVTFQMIQNTPHKTISLASKHHVIKDAAFVIYNGARISSILRRFETEFQHDAQRKLPTLDEIDFANLRLNEEWELVYAYLAQYPSVVKGCVSALREGKLNFHKLYEFLVHFSAAFSVYYSRIKIITEAREHLLPTLHARIYLLKCIERVLHNALLLLNIEVVNHM